MMNEQEFHLYAVDTNSENLDLAMSSDYSRITSEYILIYDTKKPDCKSVEITDEYINRLDTSDKTWLLECMANITIENFRQAGKTTMESLAQRVEMLGKFLEEEKRTIEQKGE